MSDERKILSSAVGIRSFYSVVFYVLSASARAALLSGRWE
jgi:hypothetical protein